MAEKDANNFSNSFKSQDNSDSSKPSREENEDLCSALNEQCKVGENEPSDLDSYLSSYESPAKREENPFSFKKFLNQDSSSQKNKGARKKIYTASGVTASKSELSDHSSNRSQPDMNVRSMCTADVSSVLPDFVQDHLVIEQCYLNGSSSINIDNLNLQNLPDLNLEHQNMHFTMNQDRDSSSGKQPINQFPNLPDFTQGVINFQTGIQESCNSDRLPDFALNVGAHATSNLDCANDTNSSFISNSRRRVNVNETNEASHSNRSRTQMSSSPSVPLDLPSYESNCDSNPNIPIPFDLTIPVDDNCNSRTGNAPETVSKSLPDFLSDGPIKKELDDNLKSIRENAPPVPNGLLFSETPTVKLEHERLLREIDMLRFQLTEKNRVIELLKSDLEHLHNTDQRETASLEYAFKEVESNLKQTTKRAANAEDMVLKLKQENKLLKAEIFALTSENMELRLKNYKSQGLPSQERKNQRIAKELRTAANLAETSLKSLLNGIDDLRMIASSMENAYKFHENNEDYHEFLQEDSASGPAL